MKNYVIVILGPTASGKTDIAIEIAKRYDGEIVSADSMQIYEHMKLGTAQPSKKQLDEVKHHMIGFISPNINYSVGEYQKQARDVIDDIHIRGKNAILCGGTGLYIDSVIKNMDFSNADPDYEYREYLEMIAKTKGNQKLYSMLEKQDPVSAVRIHPNNIKRIIRALEVVHVSDNTIKDYNNDRMYEYYYKNVIKIGLSLDRDYLYERINIRVDRMIENGLIDEAKQLIAMSSKESYTAMKALGYKELIPYFNKEASLKQCIDKIKQKTRNFAKRQISWFGRYDDINWVRIDNNSSISQNVLKVFKILSN